MERLGSVFGCVIKNKDAFMSILSQENQERYSRQIILNEVGEEGQLKLMESKILVVGAGGLGCPVLQYLVAAGVGKIGIVDNDVVSVSNLQRQILYREDEVGNSKAHIAQEKLQKLNEQANIQVFKTFLTKENIDSIINEYDIVVGATDNFESRYLIDEYSKKLGIPFIHGSVEGFEGQYSVFNYKNKVSYSDVFPSQPELPKDYIIGVMGALPGIIGSMMAMEVIKVCCNLKNVASDALYIYKAMDNKIIKLSYGE